MRFDRKTFYDEFRKWRGTITPQQVKGLNFLLECIEQDGFVQRIDWAAYMLATTMHETAYTFMPIHEYGGKAYFVRRYGGQTAKGRELGNDTPEEGYDYAGKGFPQTTGESNYEKAEIALRREYPALVLDFEKRTGKRFDLTVGDQPNDKNDPQNMLDPKIAYAVMSFGMRTGMFTGKKLWDYLNSKGKDYKGARKIINGTDKDDEIAAYAVRFDAILRKSLVTTSGTVPAPVEPKPELILEVRPQVKEIIEKKLDEMRPTLTDSGMNDALPVLTPETPSEVKDGENTAIAGQGGNSQAAGVLVNTGDKSVPDNFQPENKVIQAPPPSNMLSRAKAWLLGLGLIPTTGAGIVEAGRNLVADGTLNIQSVFMVVKQVFLFLLPYLFWVFLAFLVFWGIKELLKQISFIINQYTLARGDMNNVKVQPVPQQGGWLDAVLPFRKQPPSIVDSPPIDEDFLNAVVAKLKLEATAVSDKQIRLDWGK